MLESWERNVKKVFKRNDNYWGGPVHLDGVTYTIYSDPLVGQAAMMSGEIDAFAGMAYTGFKPLADRGLDIAIPALKSHCGLLVFNSVNAGGNDPTGNLLVRKAISHAINVEEVVAAAYLGLATPSTQFGIGTHYRNDDIAGYPYDPEKAKALLAEAGYPNGFTTKLMTEAGAANSTVLQVIQAHLANVGITADIEIPTGAAGNQAASGWGYGMWYQTSSVYVNVAMQMASMFRQNLTGNILGPPRCSAPTRCTRCCPPPLPPSRTRKRLRRSREANKLLIDEYAIYVPIAEYAYSYIVNKRVKDSASAPPSTRWLPGHRVSRVMYAYLIRRIWIAIILMVVVSAVVFIMMRLLGDPAHIALGEAASAMEIEAYRDRMASPRCRCNTGTGSPASSRDGISACRSSMRETCRPSSASGCRAR